MTRDYNSDTTCYTDFASMTDPVYIERAIVGNWTSSVTPDTAGGDEPAYRAVGLKDVYYDPGDRFTIQVNGPPEFKDRVKTILSEKVFPYVNLTFEFVDRDGACLIDNQWSMGGVCMGSGTRTPTIHLSNSSQFLVIHEFGHALGMMHESRNPSATLTWVDSALQQKYASGNTNIYKQITKQFDTSKIRALPFDQNSVMGYPLPASTNLENIEMQPSNEFTDLDKEWLRQTYGYGEA